MIVSEVIGECGSFCKITVRMSYHQPASDVYVRPYSTYTIKLITETFRLINGYNLELVIFRVQGVACEHFYAHAHEHSRLRRSAIGAPSS